MTAALIGGAALVALGGLLGVGAVASSARRWLCRSAARARSPPGAVAVLASERDAGLGLPTRDRPRARSRPAERLLPRAVAVTAVPTLIYARDAARRACAPRWLRSAAFLLALAGVLAARDVDDVPGLLGADDARPGGGDPRRPPRRARAPCSASTWRSPTSAAPASGSRCSRSPRRGAAASDAGRCRGADRVRDEGGPGPAAHLAAARAPGRAGRSRR